MNYTRAHKRCNTFTSSTLNQLNQPHPSHTVHLSKQQIITTSTNHTKTNTNHTNHNHTNPAPSTSHINSGEISLNKSHQPNYNHKNHPAAPKLHLTTYNTNNTTTTTTPITGQASEIGAAAIKILSQTWEGHLTPQEAATLADKVSRSRDPVMAAAAAELVLSTLVCCCWCC